ncbi:hypothetical protein NQ317_000916 [Molorchus minor]|uniref:Protein tipE n=1 Tax=Molorchus minor TaxID=1323400 RepID=A0ABQ9K0S1_9CUCU|nr:hypothetical protein NQ317_000916 [Molorchus minor]
MADYEPEPVTCIGTHHIYLEGISNCTWASCKEGCTKEATRCHQIYVNYSKLPFKDYRPMMVMHWDVADTQFVKQYGYKSAGTPFPCYYSRVYPEMQVVARYSWDDTLRHLILSITIPNLLFAASIGVLSYWYCPGCGRSCQKYMHHFPSEEEDFDENPY